MKITTASKHQTFDFAVSELCRLLCLMDKNIPASFSISLELLAAANDEIDTYSIDINENGGTLSGSNPRSVLYAVYRYAEALGVRWVRHGADGEYIPEGVKVAEKCVKTTSTAKNKYRGMCIEGAPSIENMLDNIDWCAKMGFNLYCIQWMIPYTFFDNWYSHKYNPLLPAKTLTDEEVIEFQRRMAAELKKRDILYMGVGHGWTAEAIGLPAKKGPIKYFGEVTEEQKELIALIDGKKSFYRDTPLRTELCYSNPKTRKKVVDCVVEYALEHPELDVLSFVLSDGFMNHCECENCKDTRPSDYYVMMMNDIDEQFTKHNLKTKICPALYHEILWAPEKTVLKNPSRFLLQFAPVTRSYETSYKYFDEKNLPENPPYIRNHFDFPYSIDGNIALLNTWNEKMSFKEFDFFTFEYYYWMFDHYKDYGEYNLTRIIYEDIQNLSKLGMKGMVTCQSQRTFMPTGFGLYTMAKTLWDDTVKFEDLADEYFRSAFGEKLAPVAREYIEGISSVRFDEENVKKYSTAKKYAEEFLAKVKQVPYDDLCTCHGASLNYLKFHAELMIRRMNGEIALLEKGLEGARGEWDEVLSYVRENELRVQSVFDVWHFCYDQLRSPYPHNGFDINTYHGLYKR